MADGEKVKEFPDVSNKLAAPKKLSQFERERQAAEVKRKQAEEENAAALRAFEDSFGHEEDDDLAAAVAGRGPPGGPRGAGMGYGGSGRDYGMSQPPHRIGPGSLGPAPGAMPPNLKRKRALDEMREAQEARQEQAVLGYQDSRSGGRYAQQIDPQDDDREDEAPRPTVHLSQLPPSTVEGDIKALLNGHLEVHSVQFLPPAGPGTATKRSLSAIVALVAETSTGQIDTTVTTLKDKYLGFGFYLTISRHLSSTALHPSMVNLNAAVSDEPFGAEKPKEPPRPSMRNAPPPMDHRGFAPPSSYDTTPRGGYGAVQQPEALVNVHAPLDIATIRAIHVMVERLTTESDPERALQLEALLMSMPEVQRDERFAFLYDSRSAAGVYYRYLLWGPDSRGEQKRHAKGLERVHDDMILDWAPPHGEVPFMDLTALADVVTDMDYASSDEESDDEGGERKFNGARDGPALDKKEKAHLSPVKRARLVHLLSRLPTSNARLRKGDVARVTNFAINHAGQGAEEIVNLLLLNVEKPLCFGLAAKYEDASSQEEEEEDDYEPDSDLPTIGVSSPQPPRDTKKEQDDPSNAKLIALYLISDILSASSTAGARNAWKYRQLFESGFKAQKTFEHLGKLDKDLAWGRLKAEQWKRRVGAIFQIWEGWSVFSGDVQEGLRKGFLEPPLSKEELKAEREAKEAEERRKTEVKWVGNFKRVEGRSPAGSRSPAVKAIVPAAVTEDVDGQGMDDVDGAPMEELNGAPMDVGEDLDGAPLDDVDGAPMQLDAPTAPTPAQPAEDDPKAESTAAKPSGTKRRMRAEDMFASDEE
ncbi:hypothetical protein LTR86_002392 [Recurvomyces mirabilis]|nr:hypothetical protein LTR86_002392 [Recurvomyces mirabilis]